MRACLHHILPCVKSRRTVYLALILLLIVYFASISRAHAENNNTIRFYAQALTPELVSGDNPKVLHEFTKLAREWEAMHPGVKIEFIKQPWEGYHSWIISQLKGGIAPDIVWSQAEQANDFAKNGWFLDISSYLERPNKYVPGNKRWMDLLYEDHIRVRRAPDGKLYVLPIDLCDVAIYYNKDIFREVGIEPPKNWEEMLDICQKLQDAGYVPMLMLGRQWMWIVQMRGFMHDQLWRDKLSLIDVRQNELGGWPGVDPQEFVRAYKKGIWSLHDPRSKESLRIVKDWSKYWNNDYLSTGDERLFRIGKAAMCHDGSWFTSRLLQDPYRKFEFGVFQFPMLTKKITKYAPGAPSGSFGGATCQQYGITNTAIKAGKEALCIDWLMFISAPRNLGPLVKEAGLSIPNSPYAHVDPNMQGFVDSLAVGPALFKGEPPMKQYDDQSFRVIQGYIGGQFTLNEAVEKMEAFLASSVDILIAENPQWNFDENWEILPDKPKSEWLAKPVSPPNIRYIPWTVLGVLLFASALVIFPRRREIARDFRKKKGIYAFVIPTIILIITFNYYPIFSAFYHSLFNWTSGGDSLWVGLANFAEMFRDPIMGLSTINIIKLTVFAIFVSISIPFVIAELIFHLRSTRAQYIYRVLFLIPMVVPAIVILLIWGLLYDYNIGPINQFFRLVGLSGWVQAWLGDPKVALYSIMLIGFPWVSGFALLIYFAGLQSIPVDVLDACKLDGASGIRRIWSVDLPLVMSQLKLLIILGLITGIQSFQNQLILTKGGPGYSTDVPGLHLYDNAMRFDRMGYSCAIGVMMFLVILALTYVNMKYVKSSTEHEAR